MVEASKVPVPKDLVVTLIKVTKIKKWIEEVKTKE
jgi:hypothetical protein